MARILLVFPIRAKGLQSWVMPHLGLGYLAKALIESGHHVELLDCVRDGIDFESFKNLMKEKDFDIIGFTLYDQDANTVAGMSSILKRELKKSAKIVIGGPYAASYGKLALEKIKDADYAFVGEAEEGLSLLAEKAKLSEIPNIITRDNIAGPRRFISDLDKVAIPAWELMYEKPYPATPPTLFYKDSNFAPIIVSRGCQSNCAYCAAHDVHGKIIRRRNLDNVMKEINLLCDKFGKKEIHIMDDNFTADKEYVIRFCRSIIESGREVHFASPNGVALNTLDAEMLGFMKKAGWHLVCVGIESGSDEILIKMRKGITRDMIKEKVRMIKEAGIDAHGFFMLGYPEETLYDMRKTIDFALELELTGASFSCFHPFYGTRIYGDLVKRGEITDGKTNEGTYAEVSYTPEGITKKRLKKIQRNAVLNFYLRPKIIKKVFSHVKSFEHFRILAKRGLNYLL